jgi:hypothetical protein
LWHAIPGSECELSNYWKFGNHFSEAYTRFPPVGFEECRQNRESVLKKIEISWSFQTGKYTNGKNGSTSLVA